MDMWNVIVICTLVCLLLLLSYLITRLYHFQWMQKLTHHKKWISVFIGIVAVIVLGVIMSITVDGINMVICFMHLGGMWLVCDGISYVVQKVRKKPFKRYYAGLFAITGTLLLLGIGWYYAHQVYETDYQITTEKDLAGEPIRIVQITDSHVGSTFHATKFEEYLQEIQTLTPDVLVITGDYVDDDTTKDDMKKSCEALGRIQAKYGVYYVFGNHDKGYSKECLRGYTGDDLKAELEKNHVTVLEDEAVLIDQRFYMIGRQDAGVLERASMSQLVEGLDTSKYMVVLDHQPTDYDAQKEAGVDLVLSGHTHGGQLFPATYVGEWTGVNCYTYGIKRMGNTDFIVSSGIGDWTIQFKTGCISEYVVIDISENMD